MKVCVVLLLAMMVVGLVEGHCQVPCGIFDDAMRIKQLKEDVATIQKAMNHIKGIFEKEEDMSPLTFNQATRWVNTKENHAAHIIETVSEYFLAQRVKEVPPTSLEYPNYLEKLHRHHLVIRAAMKTKQTVDQEDVEKLYGLITELSEYYPEEHHQH